MDLEPPAAPAAPAGETLLYCLTRDRELATALDGRLMGALAFFYNDAARLNQAVILRQPNLVVVDTAAIRQEYGDAGLGPVVTFLRQRLPDARIAVRPTAGAEWLVAAEAGELAQMLPAERDACVEAIVTFCA
jgi:hypothetical protein